MQSAEHYYYYWLLETVQSTTVYRAFYWLRGVEGELTKGVRRALLLGSSPC